MGKKIDLIGFEFGQSKVLNFAGKTSNKRKDRLWLCKCNCGKEFLATTHSIRVGDRKTCGCGFSPDLTGQRFGSGIVQNEAGRLQGKKLWLLLCDCGNYYKAITEKLRSDHIKSCGCLKHKPEWGSIKARWWSEIKSNAKNRNKEFAVSKEYVWSLFIKQNGKCALTGVELKFPKTNKEQKLERIGTASLDRIDSSKGYIEGNVQWVHKIINNMKNSMTKQELVEWAKKIVDFNSS